MDLRTAIVSHHLPYPPRGGAPILVWQTVGLMQAFGPVHVVYPGPSNHTLPAHNGRVVSHPYYDPRRPASLVRRARRRFTSTIDSLRYRGIRPEFPPHHHLGLTRRFRDTRPDIVMIHQPLHFRFLPLAKRIGAKTVYVAHNVEAVLGADIAATQGDPTCLRTRGPSLHTGIRRIEAPLVKGADQVWVCSTDDAKLLASVYGRETNVQVVPIALDLDNYESRTTAPTCRPPGDPRILLFPGVFAYEPNKEGASYLVNQIMPLVWAKYPNTRIVLAGRRSDTHLGDIIGNDDRVVATGTVPSMAEYFRQAEITLVPLLTGGGTRVKILEAFAHGTPVVSTTKGAEGLGLTPGKHLMIGDDPGTFADHIIRLLHDPNRATGLANTARRFLQKERSWTSVINQVEAAMDRLLAPREPETTRQSINTTNATLGAYR